MLDLNTLDGFEWDKGNLTKNWDSHQVSVAECEQAFFNLPLLLHDDVKHSMQEWRYYILGKTNAGRLLFIAFAVRSAKIRVISARPMSRKERQIYEEANA
jgi:uncharacterized DUF497 family protein